MGPTAFHHASKQKTVVREAWLSPLQTLDGGTAETKKGAEVALFRGSLALISTSG